MKRHTHLILSGAALALGTAAQARVAMIINESEVIEVPRSQIKTYLQRQAEEDIKALKPVKPTMGDEDILAIPERYLPPELKEKQRALKAKKEEERAAATTAAAEIAGKGGPSGPSLRARTSSGSGKVRVAAGSGKERRVVEVQIDEAVWVPPTAATNDAILKVQRRLPDVELLQEVQLQGSSEVKKEIKPGERREIDEAFQAGKTQDKERAPLAIAYKRYAERDYATAATLAMEKLSDPKSSSELKVNARYLLAHSLYQAGFYASALQQLLELMSTKWRRSALGMAAACIEHTRDDGSAYQILSQLSLAQMPEDLRPVFAFHLGRVIMEGGAREAAIAAFERVPQGAARYPEAQYYLGVLKSAGLPSKFDSKEWDNPKSLVHEARLHFESAAVESRTKSAADLRDLVNLSLARLAYQAQQFHQAVYYYGSIGMSSPWIREGLFESAWSLYRLGEYNRSLGVMHSLGTSAFEKRDLPELWILRSLNYLKLCRFEEAQRAANTFVAESKVTVPEIEKVLADFSKLKIQTSRSLLETQSLPPWASAWMVSDPVVQKDIARETLYRQERDRLAPIGENPRVADAELRQAAREALEKQLDRKISAAARALKPYVVGRLQDILGEYKRQKERLEFLRFEIYSQATRFPGALQRPQARKLIEEGEYLPGVFLKGKEILWRFNEEYWEDELRGYDYFIPTECAKG